jgi:hypothetical protein
MNSPGIQNLSREIFNYTQLSHKEQTTTRQARCILSVFKCLFSSQSKEYQENSSQPESITKGTQQQ